MGWNGRLRGFGPGHGCGDRPGAPWGYEGVPPDAPAARSGIQRGFIGPFSQTCTHMQTLYKYAGSGAAAVAGAVGAAHGAHCRLQQPGETAAHGAGAWACGCVHRRVGVCMGTCLCSGLLAEVARSLAG